MEDECILSNVKSCISSHASEAAVISKQFCCRQIYALHLFYFAMLTSFYKDYLISVMFCCSMQLFVISYFQTSQIFSPRILEIILRNHPFTLLLHEKQL